MKWECGEQKAGFSGTATQKNILWDEEVFYFMFYWRTEIFFFSQWIHKSCITYLDFPAMLLLSIKPHKTCQKDPPDVPNSIMLYSCLCKHRRYCSYPLMSLKESQSSFSQQCTGKPLHRSTKYCLQILKRYLLYYNLIFQSCSIGLQFQRKATGTSFWNSIGAVHGISGVY